MEVGNKTTTVDVWVLLDNTSGSILKRKQTDVIGVYHKRELAEQDMTKTSRIKGPFKMLTVKHRPPTPIPKLLRTALCDDTKIPIGIKMTSVPEDKTIDPPNLTTTPIGNIMRPDVIKVPRMQ